MFQHRSSFAVPFTSFFFEGEGGEGGGGGNPPKPEKPQFDDAQQKHINDLLAAERKSAEQRTEQRLKDDAAAAKTAADAEAQRLADIAKGDFEKAKSSLETERDAAATERDTLKAENEAITAYFSAQYAAAMKELPETIVAFAPAEDASFAAKSAWLTKAQEQAAKLGGELKPGNGPNPKPTDGKGPTQEEMAAQMRPHISI